MFDKVFGYPILKVRMPNHEIIKEQFEPFIKEKENFSSPVQWDCNCGTTLYVNEKNQRLPWDIFFENIWIVLNEYLNIIGMRPDYAEKLSAHAWANRYTYGQHQEIHTHRSDDNMISCAYMLDLPSDGPELGQFIFYDGKHSPFPLHLMDCFVQEARESYVTKYNPFVKDGEIIFFPSSLDHYVTWNQTDNIIATVSANFSIKL